MAQVRGSKPADFSEPFLEHLFDRCINNWLNELTKDKERGRTKTIAIIVFLVLTLKDFTFKRPRKD